MHSSRRTRPSGIASLMNIPLLGFARISGRLRSGRKKILRKNGVFKRVINDISGFSRAKMPLYVRAFAPWAGIFHRVKSLRIAQFTMGGGSNIKALTRSLVATLSRIFINSRESAEITEAACAESDEKHWDSLWPPFFTLRIPNEGPFTGSRAYFSSAVPIYTSRAVKTRG